LDDLCSYPYVAAEIKIQNQLPSKELPIKWISRGLKWQEPEAELLLPYGIHGVA